jgi:hypothetical protein
VQLFLTPCGLRRRNQSPASHSRIGWQKAEIIHAISPPVDDQRSAGEIPLTGFAYSIHNKTSEKPEIGKARLSKNPVQELDTIFFPSLARIEKLRRKFNNIEFS